MKQAGRTTEMLVSLLALLHSQTVNSLAKPLGLIPIKSDAYSSSTQIVVIGSGIAGLCCGSLLAHAGYDVTVFESHDAPGGCAHSWERNGYHFESGPSLYSGLSTELSCNPLKNVFQIIGEEPEWITYDRWGKPFLTLSL
jgi:hypothetical protein